MSQTIAYSDAVVALPDTDLDTVVSLSHLPRLRIADLYDLSSRLAHTDAIDRRLAVLTADDLRALLTAHTPCAAATALLLADDAGDPLPGVADRIAAMRALPRPEVPVTRDLDAAAPWHSVIAVQTVVLQAEHSSLPLTATGHVPVSALAEVGHILDIEPSTVSALISIAMVAGLFHADDNRVAPTPEAASWLDLRLLDAWRRLAAATVPDDLAAVVDEAVAHRAETARPMAETLNDAATARWPLAHEHLAARLQRLLHDWRVLTIIDATGRLTDLGRAWVDHDDDRQRQLAEQWPALTEYGYLYNHLELLVPGLLTPQLARQLRRIAAPTRLVETHTYQISEQTVAAALRHGEPVSAIRGFLETLLRGELSQPLEYLLRSLAESPGADGRRSRPGTESASTAAAPRASSSSARSATGSADDRDPIARARALVGEFRDSPDARIRLLLETALREHAPVSITVHVGDATRTVVLEVIGMGDTRLRGREPGAEIERTLPLKAIAEVHPITKETSWDH
ncbi:helicase-associated domain-containing protein [Pseudoclavibacter sp. 13-3]|uniref:helicase-associated domain-containing protein n=1 Tax=Pseudoclavibacter sp. 13-3 TaxID=2901228 RepID=UPI001E4D71E9|nr:helicase-associated domain-containing protein [Pseudoclavibacter sp. 13-3]MCD7101778.1 helicase-associated domain-containing protein [Pseudoclavibacter sp. 13-3]